MGLKGLVGGVLVARSGGGTGRHILLLPAVSVVGRVKGGCLMEKDFHREFKKCPICTLREELAEILGKPELKLGTGEDRYFEQLANEAKKKGLAREEWQFHFQIMEGVVVDQAKAAGALIGSEAPGFGIMTDVCMDCGCIYAIDLTRIDKKKQLPPVQPMRPGVSQKGKPLINPFSTS